MLSKIIKYLHYPTSAAPLLVFRAVFGIVMAIGTIRFMCLGWIQDHYTQPIFHFKYWGFEWVEPLSAFWLYVIHFLMIFVAIGIGLAKGILYRISAIILFLTFTYTELIDLTYYLNHYYFVSCVCLLLCFIPSRKDVVPRWAIVIFKLQIAFVYLYAGIAKINSDWLFHAIPLKIWLPAHDTLPLVGDVFTWSVTPYLFSWFGMLYDCFVVFFLLNSRSRPLAYVAVVVFHALTGMLFQIGVFPIVMIGATLIFFDFDFLSKYLKKTTHQQLTSFPIQKPLMWFLGIYFLFQILFPFRYLCYDGNLFWTEEGYRFSWRVMLMEKAGTATFYVKDSRTGREGIVDNSEFLNPHQEKQMAMQPDMILQFAHFLGKYYEKKGVSQPQVRVEAYVTLNGQPSRLLINPKTDLMKEKDTFSPKKWINH